MALSSIAGIYKNSHCRETSYAGLLGNAIKFFQKAYLVSNFSLLLGQWNKSITEEPCSIDFKFLEENLIDKIKIIICFENYLKGVLIKKGYMVHLIDTKIANKKFKPLNNISKNPILVSEYKKIENLVVDQKSGNRTYRGLKENTISLKTILTNPLYVDIHKTPKHIRDIILKYNNERNSLHLKKFDGVAYNSEYILNLKSIINFVNKKMIKDYNRLVRKFKGEEYWERFYFKEITVPNSG